MPNKYGNVRVLKPGIEHGTTAGYWRERNRKLPVCDECREAWNEACADYNYRTGRTRKKMGPRSQPTGHDRKPRFRK